jgi:hypothetical protein
MKMADILRNLADKLDSIDNGTGDAPKQSRLSPVGDVSGGDTDSSIMVPPLQAKLEILKKSEGLPNVYDGEGEEDAELAAIKKNAGLTAAQHEAADDEPLDN